MFSTPMAAEDLKAKLDNAPAADKAAPVYLPPSLASPRTFVPALAKGSYHVALTLWRTISPTPIVSLF